MPTSSGHKPFLASLLKLNLLSAILADRNLRHRWMARLKLKLKSRRDQARKLQLKWQRHSWQMKLQAQIEVELCRAILKLKPIQPCCAIIPATSWCTCAASSEPCTLQRAAAQIAQWPGGTWRALNSLDGRLASAQRWMSWGAGRLQSLCATVRQVVSDVLLVARIIECLAHLRHHLRRLGLWAGSSLCLHLDWVLALT